MLAWKRINTINNEIKANFKKVKNKLFVFVYYYMGELFTGEDQ